MISAAFQSHLKQTVSFEQFASVDDRNNITFAAAVSIIARSEGKRRMVTNLEGDRIVSSTTIFTIQVITTKDLIDGRRVLQVLDMVDGEGNLIGYESLLQ